MVERPLGGVRGWIGENSICEVRNSIKIYNRGYLRQNGIKIVFKRLFYDGFGSGYFSLGIDLPAAKGEWPDVIKIFGVQEFLISSRHFPNKIRIIDAGEPIAGIYNRGSLRRNPRNINYDVFGGKPIAVAEVLSIRRKNKINRESQRGAINKTILLSRDSQKLIPTFAVNDPAYVQGGRFLRLCIARYYAELFFFERAINIIIGSKIDTMDLEGKTWLGQRLNLSISRLKGRYRPDFFVTYEDYSMVLEQFSLLYKPGMIDDLLNGLNALGARPGLARGVLEIMDRTFFLGETMSGQQVFNYFGPGAVNMGNTYNVKADNIGAVGDGASASNISQRSINLRDEDVAELANQLHQLIEGMKLVARSDSELLELVAVTSAHAEANAGNFQGALEALKKAGKWTLAIGEKIGVGLATAALKTSLGL